MRINDQFAPSPEDRRWQPKNRYRANIPTSIGPQEFLRLFLRGRIVDGRMGGVILGKEDGNGSARLIFKVGSSYLLHGFVEGGAFLVNREASALHRQRLIKMATGLTSREIVPQNGTDQIGQMIISTAYPHDRLVWTDFGQMIVNPEPAMKHVMELQQINMSPNPYWVCDHYQAFNCEPGTPDGIV